jgi:histidinol-phosphate aminotransferase
VSAGGAVTQSISERITALKPYQPGKPIDEVKRELGISGEIIKLASNENPLGPSPQALAALRDALPRVSQYPDGGCHDLRAALAERLGIPGDHLVARPVKVPLTRPGLVHDTGAMADAFDAQRTRLVFIANPHNPTGTVVTRTQVDALLDRLPGRALLVLDEAYGEYVDAPEYPRAIDYVRDGAPVVGLRTFSKMYGLAGLRVGYGIAAPEVIRLLNQARSPFNVNLTAQIAATAALGDESFVDETRRVNAEGMRTLEAAFERQGLPFVPSHANFLLVDVGRPCRPIFGALLRRGVIVRTGDVFGLDTWLRVTVGTPEQNARFLEALGEVLAS